MPVSRWAARKLKHRWPGGSSRQVREIKSSDVHAFLSAEGGKDSKSLYNKYLFIVRGVFGLGVSDRPLAVRPVRINSPLVRTVLPCGIIHIDCGGLH